MARVLHVLTGPTAAGKTAWALRWAEAHGAEIVSCDSLLVYRGMDIGTAKPTREELARVPHHLIDVCGVTERLTVVEYARRAAAAVAEIDARGRPVLVAGGSGFYLRSFFAAVNDGVEVPAGLREELEARWAAQGLEPLVAELTRLNPAGLGGLDTANPRRVLRALERCRASGRTLAELADAFARQPAPFPGWEIRLTRLEADPESLNRRIEARARAMLGAGLLDEVRRLRAEGLESNPSAAAAIGYRECLAVLRGERPEAELAAEIVRATRGLVKKQRTWFRTQLPDHRAADVARVSLDTLFAR